MSKDQTQITIAAMERQLEWAEGQGFQMSPELQNLVKDFKYVIDAYKRERVDNVRLQLEVAHLEDRLQDAKDDARERDERRDI